MDHQNLSEHVLCMVLYLIELGLENSAEEESDEEVSWFLLFLNIKIIKCLNKRSVSSGNVFMDSSYTEDILNYWKRPFLIFKYIYSFRGFPLLMILLNLKFIIHKM